MNPLVDRLGSRRRGEPETTDEARAPVGIRPFTLRRIKDVSGVSGTGVVLEGALFSTGVVVIHWLTPAPRGSIAIFDSLEQFLSIHVRPHPENQAVLTFDDGLELGGNRLDLPESGCAAPAPDIADGFRGRPAVSTRKHLFGRGCAQP